MSRSVILSRGNLVQRTSSQRAAKRSLVLAAALAVFGCGRGESAAPLTPGQIARYGTIELAAPRDKVFDACVAALRKEGYAIDVAEPATGIVVTLPERAAPPGSGEDKGPRYRAYIVQVRATPGGGTRVTATPTSPEAASVPRGTMDWDPGRERAAWAQLFADVREVLDKSNER